MTRNWGNKEWCKWRRVYWETIWYDARMLELLKRNLRFHDARTAENSKRKRWLSRAAQAVRYV